jgi:acyl-CoA synthetase (AMP-forming)/AMP-acid ligase II
VFPIDFLDKAARARPHAIAAEGPDRKFTAAELLATARAIAASLQELTGKAHPTMAVLAPNSLELFLAIMAAHAGGFLLTPLNPRNAPVELQAQVATARPDILVADPSARPSLGAFDGIEIATMDGTGVTSLRNLAETGKGRSPRWEITDPGEVNAIKFTGGSSGRPKAVLQTFRNFNTVVVSMLSAFGFDATERYLVAAPMTHGAGMFMMPVIAAGGCCVIPGPLDASGLADALESRAITTTWMPPTLLYGLMDQPGIAGRRLSLRHLIWGGAAAAPERLAEARRVFGPVVEAVFGQTEASTIATALRADEITDDSMLASVGRATVMTRISIVAPDGRECAAGEAGEILIRGDLVMKGYLDMPEETAATLRGGWLHTGDVGHLDERGYLFIKDRLRDVVISGGFNIYPSDIEAALARHPAVSDSVVFGVPDPKWGERVEAAVQLKPGALASGETLIAFARGEVGAVKAPKSVHILETLPKSPVGKVLRREVKAMFTPRSG